MKVPCSHHRVDRDLKVDGKGGSLLKSKRVNYILNYIRALLSSSVELEGEEDDRRLLAKSHLPAYLFHVPSSIHPSD